MIEAGFRVGRVDELAFGPPFLHQGELPNGPLDRYPVDVVGAALVVERRRVGRPDRRLRLGDLLRSLERGHGRLQQRREKDGHQYHREGCQEEGAAGPPERLRSHRGKRGDDRLGWDRLI